MIPPPKQHSKPNTPSKGRNQLVRHNTRVPNHEKQTSIQFQEFKQFLNAKRGSVDVNQINYCQFIDQSESSDVDPDLEVGNEVNTLQDLHNKYDLHIQTPSTEKLDNSKYDDKYGTVYNTDSGINDIIERQQAPKMVSKASGTGGESPMRNPYLKSLEKISKFKMKRNSNIVKLKNVNISETNLSLP